tara:strand:- start:168 stop:596 length:429 start_codon:yes stop_codon:yes gene_type:complete
VTTYIEAKARRRERAMAYDAVNYQAKDTMANIIDVVRIRETYLREFRYTKPFLLSGDTALLLANNRQTYAVNAEHLRGKIDSILNTTSTQIVTATYWLHTLEARYTDLEDASVNLVSREQDMMQVAMLIQKNVIESMLHLDT